MKNVKALKTAILSSVFGAFVLVGTATMASAAELQQGISRLAESPDGGAAASDGVAEIAQPERLAEMAAGGQAQQGSSSISSVRVPTTMGTTTTVITATTMAITLPTAALWRQYIPRLP